MIWCDGMRGLLRWFWVLYDDIAFTGLDLVGWWLKSSFGKGSVRSFTCRFHFCMGESMDGWA